MRRIRQYLNCYIYATVGLLKNSKHEKNEEKNQRSDIQKNW